MGLKCSKEPSLCWDCRRAVGGCSWSRSFQPVEGWEAEPTRLALCREGKQYVTSSFYVTRCPLFERDEKKRMGVEKWYLKKSLAAE